MFNKLRLRGKLAEAGMSQEDLAKAIGISCVSMSNKMNGNVDFTLKEVTAIAKALRLTDADIIAIFVRGEEER